MMNILISTSSFGVESKLPLQMLEDKGFRYTLNPHGRKLTPEETISLLKDKDGVIAGTESYQANVINQLDNLKVISRCGAGTDGIDKPLLESKGIKLLATPNVHVQAVTELTLAGLFSITRKSTWHQHNLSQGKWVRKAGTDLQGKTIGIIGYGRIGKNIAGVLQSLGCKIAIYDPFVEEVESYVMIHTELDTLLASADIISLHLPATEESANIINKRSLSILKDDVIILNTSRGELIDEDALYHFMKDRPEAYAYLDVFKQEPYNGPLLSLPNIVATPHVGTFTKETRVKMEIESVVNLINAF